MSTQGPEREFSLPEQDRIVVAGAGGSVAGKIYIPNLILSGVPREQIVLVDSDEQRLLAVQEHVEGAEAAPDLDTALARISEQGYNLGATIIASTTAAHADNLRSVFDAVDAGLADPDKTKIWCEKPVTPPETFLEIQALAAEHPGLDVYVGYILRFSEMLTALQDHMDTHGLSITGLEWIYGRDRAGDPRPTQGVIPDKIVHPLSVTDLLLTRSLGEAVEVEVESADIQYRNCTVPMVQERARVLNPDIPEQPSSDIDTRLHYSSGKEGSYASIPVSISASYLFKESIRRVKIAVDGPEGADVLVVDFDVYEVGEGGARQRADTLRTEEGVLLHKSYKDKSAAQMAHLLELVSHETRQSDLPTSLEGEGRIQSVLRKIGHFTTNDLT